jgi:hypothetical protein
VALSLSIRSARAAVHNKQIFGPVSKVGRGRGYDIKAPAGESAGIINDILDRKVTTWHIIRSKLQRSTSSMRRFAQRAES